MIKFLGINLIEIQDLYIENFKSVESKDLNGQT